MISLNHKETEERIGKGKVTQPSKVLPRKLNNKSLESSPDYLSTSGDKNPLGDQLRKLTGCFSPVKKEKRDEDEEVEGEENRSQSKDISEKEVEDKTEEKAEEIMEHSLMIRIGYGNLKSFKKHEMEIETGRTRDKDFKYAKVERELEIRISDDPAEFEEPELYESMRLLREVGGSKVEEEGGRKRRKGGHGNANTNAKRPTLNLEKMLKV